MKKGLFKKIPRTRLYFDFSLLLKAISKIFITEFDDEGKIEEFEKKFASYCGISHALAVSYARVGLYYVLKALNLPPGSEVLMTPITIADMVNVIQLLGLKPVFLDIEEETFNIDLSELDKKITDNSRVLFVTHLFGITPDMEKIVHSARKYNLILIEDFSQSLGCRYKGKCLGTFGYAGIYSLSWIKTLSTFYGGMVITEDEKLIYKIKEFITPLSFPSRNSFLLIAFKSLLVNIATQRYIFALFTYPLLKLFKKVFPGLISRAMSSNERPRLRDSAPCNWFYKFTSFQAWLGLEGLRTVHKKDTKRIKNVNILLENLSEVACSHLPQISKDRHNICWRLPFTIDEVEVFQDYLFKMGIDNCKTSLFVCSELGVFYKYRSPTPRASKFLREMTYIPIHPTLDEEEMIYIASVMNGYFNAGVYQHEKASKN